MIRADNGKWYNTDVFRQEALKFKANGYYCEHPKGTLEYNNYWDEQLRRCKEGYVYDGQKITGHHYFYLNFCNINMIDVLEESDGAGTVKESDFPNFWDWDYEYFWWLDIARFGVIGKYAQARELLTEEEIMLVDERKYSEDELLSLKKDVVYNRLKLRLRTHDDYYNGGHHMIVAKSRRKGFSYKNTALTVNTYNTVRNSQCLIGVIDKKYSDEDMRMIGTYLDIINDYTAWGKRREIKDRSDWKRASYIEINEEGKTIEKGYKSEIRTVSFQDNPEAANGKSPYYMLFEEAGIFNNLRKSWDSTVPSLKAGKYVVGQAIIFGTGGVISDNNGEFSDMFYDPMTYNMMPFSNIWDEGCSDDWCGFFFSAVYNLEGFYDKSGNSDMDDALSYLNTERKRLLENARTIDAYNGFVVQFPICPKESFKTMGAGIFNMPSVEKQLGIVKSEKLMLKKGTCVKLAYNEDKTSVKAIPILDGKANPILEYRPKNTDLSGCPIIYEYPVENPPFGLYKIGYDPYRNDASTSDSLGAIFVYKGVMRGDFSRNIIVAEYVGRPETSDEIDEIALKFAILYNTQVMFEANIQNTAKYFERRHQLHRLCRQPGKVISHNIKSSKSVYKYGCHLEKNMKEAGVKYLSGYLKSVIDYDENGDPVTPVNYIYSLGLLEELMKFNMQGNFDRISALFQIMFQLQDEELEKTYERERPVSKISQLRNMEFFKR